MSLMNPVLAEISGESLIHAVVVIIVVGVVLALLNYLLTVIPMPPKFAQVGKIVLIIVGVLFLINILLGLIGYHVF